MTTDLHVLTGAYACDALLPEDQPAAHEHLRDCESCATEARSLLETAALLGSAAAATPPRGLRAGVLAAIAATPQLRAVGAPADMTVRRGASSLPRWALAAAASLAVLTIGVGAIAARSIQQPADSGAAQASGRTVSVTSGQASATVTVAGGTRLAFTSRGLEDPSPGRTYQLWLVEAGNPRSAGTFTPSVSPTIISNPAHAATLTVTEEPAGGSTQPTSNPILVLALPYA